MTSLTFWAIFIGCSLTLPILIITIIWLIAKTDVLFTFIREGEGIAITRGDANPTFKIAYNKYKLVYDSRYNAKVIKEDYKDEVKKTFLERWFGIYLVGIPFVHKRFVYNFMWNEWSDNVDGASFTIRPRKEPTNFFYVQAFAYAVKLEGAETKGNISVDVRFTLYVKIVSPEIALFRNDNWFEQLNGYVLKIARDYVGAHTYEELMSESRETNTAGQFSGKIIALNDKFEVAIREEFEEKEIGGVMKRLGVEILSAEIAMIDIAFDPDNLVKISTTERYRKEQESLGIERLAEARKKKYDLILENGEDGKYLFRQETIDNSGQNGNTIVFTSDNENSRNRQLENNLTSYSHVDKQNKEVTEDEKK